MTKKSLKNAYKNSVKMTYKRQKMTYKRQKMTHKMTPKYQKLTLTKHF